MKHPKSRAYKAGLEGAGVRILVTRQDDPVAYVMGYERMKAVAETLEIMDNAAAMRAVRAHRAGKTKFGQLDDIPE